MPGHVVSAEAARWLVAPSSSGRHVAASSSSSAAAPSSSSSFSSTSSSCPSSSARGSLASPGHRGARSACGNGLLPETQLKLRTEFWGSVSGHKLSGPSPEPRESKTVRTAAQASVGAVSTTGPQQGTNATKAGKHSAGSASGSHSKKHQEQHQADDLLQWMVKQGLPTSKVSLRERTAHSPHERPIHYVAASEDLQPGEAALRVPSRLVVTLERVLGDESIAELLTTNKLSELACLALYLMYEKKRGKESYWHPFIAELDRQRGRGQLAVESPLLWSDQQVRDYLQGSPMVELIAGRLAGIKREYEELDTVWFIAGSLFKNYPFEQPTEAFSFAIFKQAFVAVQACVVHLQRVSLARRFALVPLGPPLLQYRSNCRAMLKAEGDDIVLEVDRTVKAGEPISVWCGPQPNDKLLLNYGFVDEDNPYDRLQVVAALDMNDPLYQKKRAIVQRNDLLTNNTFQMYKGKEREAVEKMMPYLRLGHVTDPLELDSVSFAQGPVCGVSPCNERAVLHQLGTHFQARLDGYPTSLAEDEQLIANPKSNPKHVVATKLMRIEKNILMRSLQAVADFSKELPTTEEVQPCTGSYQPSLSS